MVHYKKNPESTLTSKERLKLRRKLAKKQRTAKKARLMVKNLPFTATEENLREHFSKFGEVLEVNLLKKSDGTLVGCAFVQFTLVQKAAKAKFHSNGQPFLGRNIECEFALAKDTFVDKIKKEKEEVEIKQEPIDVDEADVSTIKNEEIGEEIKAEVESVIDNNSENEDSLEEEDNVEDNSDQSDADEDEESVVEDSKTDIKEIKPHISNDVQEGRTVFVKNIPFTVTNGVLKECMQQFGCVLYALICMDKFTEHSKGTGFVKFSNVQDAEKCLQAGTELQLEGNILDCHKALDKNDIHKKSDEKHEKHVKDSRNLYLIKEGVLLAGSKAAVGVSVSDMAKRLQLEQYKTQMLRNLNMYISRNRLVIHNLPQAWDDSKVRQLVIKHAGEKAVIRESRVMRDMKQVDSKGMGLSKEFAFITLTTHDHALKALRSLNNNPKVFGPNKRPIVGFSIENKVMVKAKEKRLERSKFHNPKSKQYDPTKNTKATKNVPFKNAPLKKGAKEATKKGAKRSFEQTGDVAESFSGVAATPGAKKMRSRYNLKTQAELHFENLKNEKKKKKFAKKSLKERTKDFIKQPQQKINRKNETDGFSKLVSDYKNKLYTANADASKSKWYE